MPAYDILKKQLIANIKAATSKQDAAKLKRDISLLKYQRLNAIKQNDVKAVETLDGRIELLSKKQNKDNTEVPKDLWEGLQLKASEHNDTHIRDIADYISYQRTYQELIERYNPGLTMTQEDNIRKTANRVGFEMPKEK